MTPAELLIIYSAAGAPYGVYAFFEPTERPAHVHAVVVLLKFAVWPVFATLLIVQRLSRKFSDTERPLVSEDLAKETEALRKDISSTLMFENDQQRRQLLDEFERFAGISAAIQETGLSHKPSTPIILEASGHTNPSLGAKCIFRRNRARLIEHRNRAFDGFVAELEKASTNGGPFTIDDVVARARRLVSIGES